MKEHELAQSGSLERMIRRCGQPDEITDAEFSEIRDAVDDAISVLMVDVHLARVANVMPLIQRLENAMSILDRRHPEQKTKRDRERQLKTMRIRQGGQ